MNEWLYATYPVDARRVVELGSNLDDVVPYIFPLIYWKKIIIDVMR
jgi:hypothetical protein